MTTRRTQQRRSQSRNRNPYGRFERKNNNWQRYGNDYDTDYELSENDNRYENRTNYENYGRQGDEGYNERNNYGDNRQSYQNSFQDRNDKYDQNDEFQGRRSGRSRQGFASMDREEVREIANRGDRVSYGGSFGKSSRPYRSSISDRGRSYPSTSGFGVRRRSSLNSYGGNPGSNRSRRSDYSSERGSYSSGINRSRR